MRAVAIMVTGLLTAACDSLLGIPGQEIVADASDGGAAPDSDGDAVTSPLCNLDADYDKCFKCTDEYCCTEYLACHDDSRCGDYYKTCLPSCRADGGSSWDCVVLCDKQYGGGHAVFAPYQACNFRHCLAPCSNGLPDPCISCLYASCGDVAFACDADRECDTLFNCATGCNGLLNADSCSAGCKAGASQQAQDELNAELTCALTYCQNACAGKVPGQ